MTNPYVSPAILDTPKARQDGRRYRSRMQAVLAGLWRGAIFGGKWMAAILIVLAILVWTPIVVLFLYRWLWQGCDAGEMIKVLHPVRGICLTLLFIINGTLCAAVVGALIMGTAAGITYRKAPANGAAAE